VARRVFIGAARFLSQRTPSPDILASAHNELPRNHSRPRHAFHGVTESKKSIGVLTGIGFYLDLGHPPSPAFWIQAGVARHISHLFYRTAFLLHGYHALLIFVALCAGRAPCRSSLLIMSFLPLYFLLRPLPLRSPTTREDTQYTSESIKAYTPDMEHLLLTRPAVIHHLLSSPEVRNVTRIKSKPRANQVRLIYSTVSHSRYMQCRFRQSV
jgi:hypothetical protein